MPSPTQNDLSSVNPVLTNLLIGYQQKDTHFVASRAFPVVPVATKSGTYYAFDKKYWMTDEMKQRAPGGRFARAEYGVSTDTYSALQWALEVPVADEDRAASQAPLDLETAAVKFLNQKSLIRKERAFSADFMKTSVWGTDNNSATDWDDASGVPIANVETAKSTVLTATGVLPNTMIMGYIVHAAIKTNSSVLARVQYTQTASDAVIEQILASLFGVEKYLVSAAGYNSANTGQTASIAAIIDDDCLVCYSNDSPTIFEPSAGYTFAWNPGGGIGSIYNVRSDENHADLIQIAEQWDQKLVASDLGYFFTDIV